MTCATCQHAKRESLNAAITRHMARFGSAVCQAYSKRLKRPLLIPLQNAGGMVCSGKWYEPMAGQVELI